MTETSVLRVAVGSTNPSKLRSVQQALQKALAPSHRHANSDNNNNQDTDNHHDDDHNHCSMELHGFDVPSLVSDQPMGDDETRMGAMNRAKAARDAYLDKFSTEPHLAIGLEGGLLKVMLANNNNDDNEENGDDECSLWCMAWMAIYGQQSKQVYDLMASVECRPLDDDNVDVVKDDVNGDEAQSEETKNHLWIWGLAMTGMFALPTAIANLVLDKGMELGDADDQVFGRTRSKHGSGTVGKLTDGIIDRSAYYEHALLLALIPWIRPDVYPKGHPSKYANQSMDK